MSEEAASIAAQIIDHLNRRNGKPFLGPKLAGPCELCDRAASVWVRLGPDDDPDTFTVACCDVCHEQIRVDILTEELVAEGIL